jgi:hypothetical protein
LSTEEQARKSFESWPPNWRAQVLKEAPMIAPARQFTYPLQIAGEEDALARGALCLLVHPPEGGAFLATCALGFASASVPTGLFACPAQNKLCAVAGGYAYVIDATQPKDSVQVAMKPVMEVLVAAEAALLLFVGFHKIVAWGAEGFRWETANLSWEGVRTGEIDRFALHGTGWNMPNDQDVPFTVDLRTGEHVGGGCQTVGVGDSAAR